MVCCQSFCFVLYIAAVLCGKVVSESEAGFTTTPADVAIARCGKVYIVAGKTLYLLQSNLTQLQSLLLTTKDTAATNVLLSSDGSTLMVCFKDGTCFAHLLQNLFSVNFTQSDTHTVSASIPGEKIAIAAGAAARKFYIGSAGYSHHAQNHIILLRTFQFVYDLLCPQESTDNFVVTNRSFFSRIFHYAFQNGSYIYFVVEDSSTNVSFSKVTLLRICDDGLNDTMVSGMIEVQLQCNAMEHYGGINSITVLDIYGDKKILIGFDLEYGYEICSFDLNDIDSVMESVFQECVNGIHKSSLPWVDDNLTLDCSTLTEVCNIFIQLLFTLTNYAIVFTSKCC